jgi:hypothetical protein
MVFCGNRTNLQGTIAIQYRPSLRANRARVTDGIVEKERKQIERAGIELIVAE